jgi:hypothetical protein
LSQTTRRSPLELRREELEDLHSALWPAIVALQREPGILNDLIQECDGIDDPDEITGLIYNASREEETVEELLWSFAYSNTSTSLRGFA